MTTDRHIPGAGRPFRLFTVLDKMIMKDVLKTVIAVLTVLVVIIVSRKFIKILAQAVEGNIANETVLNLLGLKMVVATATFLPAATFMAVLMVLGRMHREQEMAAIASAGGGIRTIYRSVMLMIIPLCVASVGLSMYAAPWAEAQTKLMMHQDKQSADIRGISAGRFSEYSDGELIFYTESVDEAGTMQGIFVQNKQGDKLGVVNAKYGRLQQQDGGLYLILQQGERLQGIPGQKDYSIEKFDEYAVLVEKKATTLSLERDAFATKDLWYSAELRDIAELQDRLNGPLGVLLLAFLAVPLSRLSPRGGVYGSVLAAFGIYFVYGNLQRVNHSWVISGNLPPWLGYVWVDGILSVLGLSMVLRFYGWQWILQSLTGKVRT